MTPETSVFLAAADRAVANAHSILAINITDQAARLAYYAQFYAAQAVIFERTAKNAKTHKGVDSQFHRLAKAEPSLTGLAGQLSAAYRFKEAADYEADAAASITQADARDAIATAESFVAVVRQVLAAPAPP
jgi:uncharacterized protein (UPF0332 family)